MVYFAPNLTPWVQPLDAGIIRCFKAHYRRRFLTDALQRDELGEADIYNINLLQVLQMATAAWDDVTPETIQNCWKHTGIQRDPITIRLPAPTLTQKGWSIIMKFASTTGMTLPSAENELKALFKDQYNDEDWRPALKVVTESEPDDNVIEAISKLQELTLGAPATPSSIAEGSEIDIPEYNDALMDVGDSIRALKQRNRLFGDTLKPCNFIELEGEEEEVREEVRLRTDDEIVAEVTREEAKLDGEDTDVDEDKEDTDNDEKPGMTLAEMMDTAMRLENEAPTAGGCGSEVAKILRRFRLELRRTMDLEAQQTTLDRYFTRDP